MLDPVAETADCRQLVSRVEVNEITLHETPYGDGARSTSELIKDLQKEDVFTREKLNSFLTHPSGKWRAGEDRLLRHDGKLYVPEFAALRCQLLLKYHDDPLAGHFGTKRTTELLSRNYYWPGMRSDVNDYVTSCAICQRFKVHKHKPYGVLTSLPVPEGPWQELTMDFITGLPPSKRDGCVYDSILVVVDRYSKYCRYIPTTVDLKADKLAEIFLVEIVARFGVPIGVVSDRGSLFTSNYWSQFCFNCKIKKKLSTAFHPQTDGQTERQNQTLEHYLRCYCDSEQSNWAKLLPFAEFAYANSEHSTLGVSPFKALYGYDPKIEIIAADGVLEGEVPDARERIEKLHELRQSLTTKWQEALQAKGKYYDRRHQPKTYNVGDLVMLSTKNLKQRLPSKKLSPRYVGPYRIVDIVGKQAYRLALPASMPIHNTFHVSLLEKYQGRAGYANIDNLPEPELINDEEQWEVEDYLNRRVRRGAVEFLIKWTGYPDEYNEWIKKTDLTNGEQAEIEWNGKRKHFQKR